MDHGFSSASTDRMPTTVIGAAGSLRFCRHRFAIVTLVLLAVPLAPARGAVIDVSAYGAKCDGASDDSRALATAASEASARGSALSVSCRVRVAGRAVSVPSAIVFAGGGSLDLQRGASVTLGGPLTAPLTQVFFENGGLVQFSGTIRDVVPQWWGAKGDGTADDSSAINAAAAAIRRSGPDSGIRFLLPGVNHREMNNSFRNFYLISSPIDLTELKNIAFESRLFYVGNSGVALTIGTASAVANTKAHFLITGLSVWGRSARGTTGVLVRNVSLSDIQIVGSSSFETGVLVWADDLNYVAHTTFRLQDVRGCVYGVVLNSSGNGWINENLFLGGDISALRQNPGLYGIWIRSAGYRHNNNTFLKPCLQGWAVAIRIDSGISNSFLDIRNEASVKTAAFNNDSEYNVVRVLSGETDSSDSVVSGPSTNLVTSLIGPLLQPLLTRDFTDAYDDGAFIHVPGFDVRSAAGIDNFRGAIERDLAINRDKSLALRSGVTVGIDIDTRSVRSFMLTVNQPSGALTAVPRITCYDEGNRVLSGSAVRYVTSSLLPDTLAPNGSVYERTTGRRAKEVRFISFRSEVAHAFVGVAATDAIWGFNLYAIGALERQSAGYSLPYAASFPLEVWGVYESASPPTSCGWPVGTHFSNVDPATVNSTTSWVCTSRADTAMSSDVHNSDVLRVDDITGIHVGDRVEVLNKDGTLNARLIVTSVERKSIRVSAPITALGGSIVRANGWASR